MLTRKQARDKPPSNDGSSNTFSKRPAEGSPIMQQPQKKRSALGDITNDLRKVQIDSSKKAALKAIGGSAAASLSIVKSEVKLSVPIDDGSSSSQNDVLMLSSVEESIVEDVFEDLAEASQDVAEIAVAISHSYGIRTDYDLENEWDSYNIPHYAQDIFDYYRGRETCFIVTDYIDMQQANGGISRQMRAILIDWMVEVQESFELNHETLYQAVKMTDLYLERVVVDKETLQLVGATALFISSKFDERQPPLIDDFLYICDDAYTRKEIMDMEEKMLKKLQFDIGFPLSYRFLRRYAKTTKADMVTLTLARYILEMSLMHYEFVHLRESMVAAAALMLALRMKDNSEWSDLHIQYTGYTAKELEQIMWDLNGVIKGSALTKALGNIRAKYSHEIFSSVAKMPPLASPLVSPALES